ncbi:MAG: molybdopterin biosynthesis protein [Armatimonadetes bacterium]|nr:molybdopterin biosynthesis protein [Armatimonadota bacterium]
MDSDHLQLQDVPLDEALDRWLSELEFLRVAPRLGAERVAAVDSLHRVTASPVLARLSSPHYHAAAIDGLAVRSAETFSASAESRLTLRLGVDGLFVDTGSPLPEGFDAVVPFHEIEPVSNEHLRISRPSNPWRNVRPIGEDVVARELILPRNHRIGPLDIGVMVASGVNMVRVYRKPRVAIVPVGSSLVQPGERPALGQMIESNSPVLSALLTEAGAAPQLLSVVPERLEEAGQAVVAAAREHEMVVVVAGPSHGTAFLARIFSDSGDCVLRGVSIKPGHSVALGVVDGTPTVGLPFHPVPAFHAFELFCRPVLAGMIGQSAAVCGEVLEDAILAVGVKSPPGVEEFLRVKMGLVDERRIAVPDSGGAANLMSLVRATGIVRIPADCERLNPGETVRVRRLAPGRSMAGNILLLGTHDICYDLLRSDLMSQYPDLALLTAATGGAVGLQCLKNGYCHIAAIHLFDEETGEYNIPHLQREMSEVPVVLVNLFKRQLGLITAAGNPKEIRGLEDLTREDLTFINRQEGSGTRALLDYHLRREGVDVSRIQGFDRTVKTHMSVAAAISGEAADVGPGISTAARALRLEFVPCIVERLDLAIPKKFFNLYPFQALLQSIRSGRFRREAAASLADYDFSQTGQVLWESY